ncbi:MAG TPA: hypothetical protein VEG29_02570, partial [Candidatus Binatia bacterium]|nr:hypothetical protein [Candidatus Binatia bacterium]
RAGDDQSFSMHLMSAVASGPSGFMAVGASCGSGECYSEAIWTSTDGVSWHEAAPLPAARPAFGVSRTVAASGSGWFVGGSVDDDTAGTKLPAIWTTTDGSSWTVATVALPLDGSTLGTVAGLAVSGGTDLAVGSDSTDTSRTAVVWTSTDGVTWSAAPADASFSGSIMSAVVPGGPGYVAVGRDASGAAVWTSKEGSSWKEDSAGPGFAGAQMLAVAASAGRLTAVGYDGNTALIWTSTDGLSWAQASPASDMAGAQALSVAMGASTDVVVGGTSSTGKVWTRTASH